MAKLRLTGNVSLSCKSARKARSFVYVERQENSEFRAAWDDALEQAADVLEAEAWRRATKGTRKPVYQGGVKVGEVQEYSDTLLIFLLKGNRPNKFRERAQVEHTGPGGGPQIVEIVRYEIPDNGRDPDTEDA